MLKKPSTQKPKKIKKPKQSDFEVSMAYKFKMATLEWQSKTFRQWGGSLNLVSNAMYDERIITYNQWKTGNHSDKIYLNAINQNNKLPELKKLPGYEFLNEVPAQLFQQKTMDLENSFSRFFEGISEFPQKRKRKIHGFSMKFPDSKQFEIIFLNKNNAVIDLPKIGKVRFKTGGRKFPEGSRIRSCTIKGDSAGINWTVSFNFGIEKELFKKEQINWNGENNGPAVGGDRGIVITMQLSNGQQFNLNTDEIQLLEKYIGKLQKQQSKMKLGSQNWKKLQVKINKVQARIVNIRMDFIHKMTTTISKNHGLVVIEDLRLKNMTKSAKGTFENPGTNIAAKSGLNKSLLRVSMGEQSRQLEYKCSWYDSYLVKVNPNGTSCTCRICEYRDKKSRKSQSVFECLNCGHTENADLHASKVIEARGQRALVCGESVDEKILSDLSFRCLLKQKPLRKAALKAA
jgi:putative transposase